MKNLTQESNAPKEKRIYSHHCLNLVRYEKHPVKTKKKICLRTERKAIIMAKRGMIMGWKIRQKQHLVIQEAYPI